VRALPCARQRGHARSRTGGRRPRVGRQIERALAIEIDGPLPALEAERVRRHLRECAACRALAHALRLLPRAYRDLPQLHAGRAFTQAVIRRTSGRPLGRWHVLRAMWRSPAFVWEGAVICSLLVTPVLGPSFFSNASRLEQQLQLARTSVQIAAVPTGVWSTLRREATETRRWVEVTTAALRVEARMHLEPIRERCDEWVPRLGLRPDSKANEPSEGGHDELRQP
jgi:anti-sigma factor RsiW